jgi:hypothetical protein
VEKRSMIWLIQSIDLTQIAINHISSLKNMSRESKTHDFIYIEVEKHKKWCDRDGIPCENDSRF